MEKAVVLFSGGQDSTTCLYWAKKNFYEVQAIGFSYGQRHVVELDQAQKIADFAQVRFDVISLEGCFGNSALLEEHTDLNKAHTLDSSLPSSFVPGRNITFLSVAASIAAARNIFNLVGGMCETDYSGYPDCRRNFIDSMETSLSLGIQQQIKIHTPLMLLNKAQTWKLAKDLDCLEVVREHSHTDYNGDRTTKNEWGYGKLDNPASVLRAKGYEEAKAKGWV